MLISPRGEIAAITSMRRSLPHDVTNGLAAAALVLETGLADVSAVAGALASFIGPPHRIELVAEAGGVAWFNDSKATTPHAAAAAIGGFGHSRPDRRRAQQGPRPGADGRRARPHPHRCRHRRGERRRRRRVRRDRCPGHDRIVDGRGCRRRRGSCPPRRRRPPLARLRELRLVPRRRLRGPGRPLPRRRPGATSRRTQCRSADDDRRGRDRRSARAPPAARAAATGVAASAGDDRTPATPPPAGAVRARAGALLGRAPRSGAGRLLRDRRRRHGVPHARPGHGAVGDGASPGATGEEPVLPVQPPTDVGGHRHGRAARRPPHQPVVVTPAGRAHPRRRRDGDARPVLADRRDVQRREGLDRRRRAHDPALRVPQAGRRRVLRRSPRAPQGRPLRRAPQSQAAAPAGGIRGRDLPRPVGPRVGDRDGGDRPRRGLHRRGAAGADGRGDA